MAVGWWKNLKINYNVFFDCNEGACPPVQHCGLLTCFNSFGLSGFMAQTKLGFGNTALLNNRIDSM